MFEMAVRQSFFSRFIVLAIYCASIRLGLCDIDFVGRHPEPTTRAEGQIVPCYCEYEGTQVLPFWAINDTVFSPTHLPPIYTVNRSGLFFIADESLNQTHFQCLFVTYNTSTHMFESQNSQVGVIYVTEDPDYTPMETDILSCGMIGPIFTGIISDNETIDLFWNASMCTNITVFSVAYAICTNMTETPIEGPIFTFNTNVQFNRSQDSAEYLLFSLTVEGYATKNLAITEDFISGSMSEMAGRSDVQIPMDLNPAVCEGGGMLCIHTDSSDQGDECFLLGAQFCPEIKQFGYKCHDVEDDKGEIHLRLRIVTVEEKMNNTLYTYSCGVPCNQTECSQGKPCEAVQDSVQLTVLAVHDTEDVTDQIIIGVCVGVGSLLFIICLCFIFCCCWRRQDNRSGSHDISPENKKKEVSSD